MKNKLLSMFLAVIMVVPLSVAASAAQKEVPETAQGIYTAQNVGKRKHQNKATSSENADEKVEIENLFLQVFASEARLFFSVEDRVYDYTVVLKKEEKNKETGLVTHVYTPKKDKDADRELSGELFVRFSDNQKSVSIDNWIYTMPQRNSNYPAVPQKITFPEPLYFYLEKVEDPVFPVDKAVGGRGTSQSKAYEVSVSAIVTALAKPDGETVIKGKQLASMDITVSARNVKSSERKTLDHKAIERITLYSEEGELVSATIVGYADGTKTDGFTIEVTIPKKATEAKPSDAKK